MYFNTFLIPLIAIIFSSLFTPVAAIPAPEGEVEAAGFNPNLCKQYCVYRWGEWRDKEGKKWRDPYCRDWCKRREIPECDIPRDCRKHDVPWYCRNKCPQCNRREECRQKIIPWYCRDECPPRPECKIREDCRKKDVPWYCEGKCPTCRPREDCRRDPIPWFCSKDQCRGIEPPRCHRREDCKKRPVPWYCKGQCDRKDEEEE